MHIGVRYTYIIGASYIHIGVREAPIYISESDIHIGASYLDIEAFHIYIEGSSIYNVEKKLQHWLFDLFGTPYKDSAKSCIISYLHFAI